MMQRTISLTDRFLDLYTGRWSSQIVIYASTALIVLGYAIISDFWLAWSMWFVVYSSAILTVLLLFVLPIGYLLLNQTKKAPGHRLLLVVDFFYSPKTVEQIFKPLIADWRVEYFEALNRKRQWKARWIMVVYTFNFMKSLGLSIFSSLTRVFRSTSR